MPRIRDLSRTNGVKRVPHLYSVIPAMASHQLKQLLTTATETNTSATKSTTGRMRSSYVYRNTRTNKPKTSTATTKPATNNRVTWPSSTSRTATRKPKPKSNGKKK